MLTQVDWSVNGLHYFLWPETDFSQHTYCMKLSPSMLDLWELADPMASSETLFAQTQSKPVNYKEKSYVLNRRGL